MPNAIVTLLFTQSYLPGVLVLGKTLRQLTIPYNTKLVVLLATPITEYQKSQLDQVFDELIEISLIYAPVTPQLTLLGRPELSPTYSKINLFKLTQFDKVLYLDADTLPLKPLDELFDYEITPSQIVAAPDSGWPDIFNSGVFLIRPSIEIYLQLLEKIHHNENPSFDGADQGLLNEFFHLDHPKAVSSLSSGSGSGVPREWIRLPFIYNVTPTGQYEYQPAYNYFHDDIKLLHFIGNVKPWDNPSASSGLKDRWWSKFYEFYGSDADIQKSVHGIDPIYYNPPAPEGKEPDVKKSQITQVEPPESPEIPVESDYELANQVLSNPRSFEKFHTVPPNEFQWNPAYEEPPKDGKPEAASFPQDLQDYSGHWEESEAYEEAFIDEQEVTAEEQWAPPPAIFPWEFEKHQVKAERVFYADDGSYDFSDPWRNLPIIKKIQSRQSIDEVDPNENEEKEVDLIASENNKTTKELANDVYIKDQQERLKEIERRYSGGIQDLDIEGGDVTGDVISGDLEELIIPLQGKPLIYSDEVEYPEGETPDPCSECD